QQQALASRLLPQAILALLGALLLLPAAAGAETALTSSTLEIGPELHRLQYREAGLMKENGVLYGGFIRLTIGIHSNLIGSLSGSLTAGEARYDGQTMAGLPLQQDTPQWLMDLRATLGYQWRCLLPFSGLGLRYWNDNLAAHSPYGYKRQTAYLFSPLGLEISKTCQSGWQVGVRWELDWLWLGLNRNTDFPLDDQVTLDFYQHSGYGTQASLFLKYSRPGQLGFMLEPFWQYWNIQASERQRLRTATGISELYEPANTSTLFGLRGGLRW
ncbi:MAG: hypothetical protein GX806_05245, partial [Lentisphaerae bacterium]|nr:hypothetical protein [Lentisphaerota bacterium]